MVPVFNLVITESASQEIKCLERNSVVCVLRSSCNDEDELGNGIDRLPLHAGRNNCL